MAKRAKALKLAPGARLAKAKFDETKHKRDLSGKFANKPGAGDDVPKSSKPVGSGGGGKSSGVKGNDVIQLHVSSNPKKAGSASAADFAHYKSGMTVDEFISKVGKKGKDHIAWDIKKGYITVHAPGTTQVKVAPQPAPAPAPAPAPVAPAASTLTSQQYKLAGKDANVGAFDQIKIHATGNPKKAGSKSADEFAKYQDEITVGDYIAAVGDKKKGMANIKWDIDKGYISVHSQGDLAGLKAGTKTPEQVALKNGKSVPGLAPGQTGGTTAFGTKPPAPTPQNVAPQQKTKVKDLGTDEELHLVNPNNPNPYSHGSDEYIKYQSFVIKPQTKMTYGQYKQTQALSVEGKDKALQKLMDDGYVKHVPSSYVKKIQDIYNENLNHTIIKGEGGVDIKLVKVAGGGGGFIYQTDNQRWAKAGGIHTRTHDAQSSEGYQQLKDARDHLGAPYVGADNSSAVSSYTGSGYHSINAALRNKEPGAADKQTVKRLDNLMGEFQNDTYLFRGVGSYGKQNDIPPPLEWEDLGFGSASYNPRVSSGFAGQGSKGLQANKGVLFRIRVPKGARGVQVARHGRTKDSALRDEAEVVLARGTRYRYVQTVEDNMGRITIEIEVVRADGSSFPP